jgi:plasmid stabilization system protein ParE
VGGREGSDSRFSEMIELILLNQADWDIQAAYNRYEEYQAGRGEVFLRQVEAALTLLRQHPELAPQYGGQYRRMLIRDFPYGIFYEAQPTRVIVGAIMDLRQDPRLIRRKLLGD